MKIYTLEEFKEWLENHPEVINVIYYKTHYKEYKIRYPKLPSNTYYSYNKSKIEIFSVKK